MSRNEWTLFSELGGRFHRNTQDRDKEVWVILGNYRPHRSIAPKYESKYQVRLYVMSLPPYSPELNPEENICAWLKDYCSRYITYTADKELSHGIRKFFIYAYNTPSKVDRRADSRLYFKTTLFHFQVVYP